jgi:hypothetical protein
MFQSLVYPMFAMVILVFVVLLVMARKRVGAVRSGRANVNYFKTYQGELPRDLSQIERHFTNLFELPVIFYVVCLTAMIVRIDGAMMMGLAWAFVVLRIVHAIIHIGSNKLPPRMAVYLAQWIVVLAMWILIILALNAR